jgi:hypothetical protein
MPLVLPAFRAIPIVGLCCMISAQVPPSAVTDPTSLSSGQIGGKVLSDADGTFLSGATVKAFRISPAPRMSVSTASATGGSFTLLGLTAGTYELCVNTGTGAFDQCQWKAFQTVATITSGQVISGLVIRLKKSSTLTVRVNDATQALVQKPTDTAPPQVLVGAFDLKGTFHPAGQLARDDAGITYQLLVPTDYPMRLAVFSQQVKLVDSAQKPVLATSPYTIVAQSSSETQPLSFTFTATGRNP